MSATPGFCPDCGTILPKMKAHGGVTCFLCRKEHSVDVFGDMYTEYTVHFNDVPKEDEEEELAEESQGPVVDRRCPKCNSKKMSYATLQLRSADEGQTCFYTCIKCNYKETENS